MKILSVGEEKKIGNGLLRVYFVHNAWRSIRYPRTTIATHENEIRLRVGDIFNFCEIAMSLNGFVLFAQDVISETDAGDQCFSLCLIVPVINLTRNIDDQRYLYEGLLRIRTEKEGQFVLEGVKQDSDTAAIFTAPIARGDLEKLFDLAREAKEYLGKDVVHGDIIH